MIELQGVSFGVEGEKGSKEILRDIDLKIEDGRLLVVTGPNGGGKSTLARLIMGIERPTHGRILMDGEDITGLDATQRAKRGIGFAFQQPVRFRGLRVRDLLRLSAGRELSTGEACSYLSEVGLCAMDYVDREMDASLSGGELKRIEIATLMARHARLSIYDEPEAGIDLWSFHNLIRAFIKQRGEGEGAVLIISHQERILNIADTIAVVSGGEITRIGPRDTLLGPLLAEAQECPYLPEGALRP